MANVAKVPKIYTDALDKFIDDKSPIAHIVYPFLNVAVSKTKGTLMLIPLLSRKEGSLYKRLGLTISPAYIILWSPTTKLNPISKSRDILIVMDEYNWVNSFLKTITLNGSPPTSMKEYEKLMDDCKFFTGLNCVVVTNDMGVRVIPTSSLLVEKENK